MKEGEHSHQCGYKDDEFDPHAGCGHVWQHSNLCILLPSDKFERAHRCPNCGKGPWKEKLESREATTLDGLFKLLRELEEG